MQWYQKEAHAVMDELGTSPQGLSSSEAERRLQQHGPNQIREKQKKTPLAILLDQFKDFMIIVLIAAAVVSGFIGEPADTIAIIVIVLLNALIGFVQEYRAEKAIEALKKLAAPEAFVLRDGVQAKIPAAQVVPGDVVMLEAGEIVPADIRITESAQLRIEEAALTGESVPVDKITDPIPEENLSPGDRRDMAFKSTTVSYGRGTGIVTETGMNTEIGKIAGMIQEAVEVRTPLQKRLAKFGQKLAIAVIIISIIVFGIGVLRGDPVLLMLLTAISLAVAAIPEALPAVVTISLALGAKKMVRQNALIRKLPAVETLGSVTYICSDKTGTLTLNKMSVEEVYLNLQVQSAETYSAEDRKRGSAEGKDKKFFASALPIFRASALMSASELFLTAMALSNDAQIGAEGTITGDPTEIALYSYAKEKGFLKEALQNEFPRVYEIPFDSERKRMTTVHKVGDAYLSFTKGAIEAISERARALMTSSGEQEFNKRDLLMINDRMAADGLRVLAIAMRRWEALPEDRSIEIIESELVILGLVGMMDPPREEALNAISECKAAGIIPVMITGDHPITAKAIAKRLSILEDGGTGAVITGKKLESLSDSEFEQRVQQIRVYARVAPQQKLRIVKALQDKGQFIAMTGDGVNDAPALKRADIGIAMGVTGTDVAKEAAHMILLDDNFATIVKAVKEGRRIFDNIRKFIRYTMTSNSGEIWTIFLAPFFGLPIPLLPIHILWINLVTDGLPGLALAAEPAEKDIMQRPPRHPQESIFAHGLGAHIIWVGLLMGAVSLFTQAWSIATGLAHWQTMVFTVLTFNQMGHVLAIRSEKESLFAQGIFSNRPLIGAVALTFILQLATIYVPFLNPIFKTEPLSAGELALTLVLSTVVFFAVEIEKLMRRRGWLKY